MLQDQPIPLALGRPPSLPPVGGHTIKARPSRTLELERFFSMFDAQFHLQHGALNILACLKSLCVFA